ncbi:MAG: hypothetical protein ACRDWF_12920 [Acidimicrobiia bacterium]
MSGDTTTVAEEPATAAPTIEETTTSAAGETSTGLECGLVPPETVAAAFDATSASGEPGVARNCTFTLVDGLVPTVDVFHYGSSTDWDGVKAGFEENRGGVTDVPEVGDVAFQPNDVGPYEIVVKLSRHHLLGRGAERGRRARGGGGHPGARHQHRRRLIASRCYAGPCGPDASGTYNPGPLCRI